MNAVRKVISLEILMERVALFAAHLDNKGASSMNLKNEANRLADCREMDRETLKCDIEMAFENALEKANFALEQIHAQTIKRMNASLPQDTAIIKIYEILTNYFKE